jgi:hypothetical protein
LKEAIGAAARRSQSRDSEPDRRAQLAKLFGGQMPGAAGG